MTATGEAAGGRIARYLVNEDFAKLWYGQAISRLGDFVFTTTLTLWIATRIGAGRSWAPAAVSGVLAAVGVAVLVVGPAAGVYVDRWNRRRTMLWTEAVRGVLVGALAAVAFVPVRDLPVGVWLALIYVVVFAVNAAGTFFDPARMATVTDVVEGEADVARAAGITQATSAVATIVGPPLAAPLLFAAGVQWAIVLNALSYVVSYAAIRSVRRPDTSGGGSGHGSFREELSEGVRYFRTNRTLVTVLILATIATVGTGALNTLDVFFVTGNLHARAGLYGFLATAEGVGGILGALLAGAVVARIGARSTLWSMLGATGLVLLLYARQTEFGPGLALLVAASLPVSMLNTATSPIVLRATPRQYLGRVVSVMGPVQRLADLGSAAAAGLLMSTVLRGFHAEVGGVRVGPVDTIFTVTALLFLASAAYGFKALPRGQAADPAPESGDAVPEPAL